MSTKPATVATWDTSLANLVAPTAGHRLNGYAVNEVPTSGELNGQLNLIGAWAQYLSDAVLTGGASVAGSLTVTGGLVADGAQVNGALGVTGAVLLTTSARCSVADTIVISPTDATCNSSSTLTRTESRWAFGTATDPLCYPLRLTVGDKVTGFRAFLNKTSASGTVTVALRSVDASTGVIATIASATYAASSGFVQLAQTAAYTLSSVNVSLHIAVTGGGTTGDLAFHAAADIVRP